MLLLFEIYQVDNKVVLLEGGTAACWAELGSMFVFHRLVAEVNKWNLDTTLASSDNMKHMH